MLCFEQTGDEAELARTLSGSIQPLLLLGPVRSGVAAGERAARRSSRGKETLDGWHGFKSISAISTTARTASTEALAFYESAYEEMLNYDDGEALAAVLSNLSLLPHQSERFSQSAGVSPHRPPGSANRRDMPILVAYADYNIAYLYFLRGEYGRAIQMLRDAAISAEKANDAYQSALCNLDLAEIYLELNLSSRSRRAGAGGARRLPETRLSAYEGAKALGFAAIAASRMGQAFEGVKFFAQAKEMFVRDKNQVWPSLIDLYQAWCSSPRGACLRLGVFARRRMNSSASRRCAARRCSRSCCWRALRCASATPRLAKKHCQTALADLEELESPVLLYQAEFLMGEIGRASGNEEEAYESYCRARAAVERLRGSLRGEELKLAFFENKLEVYESLVDMCLRRHNSFEEAFGYIEEAKSRVLADLLRQPVHVHDG